MAGINPQALQSLLNTFLQNAGNMGGNPFANMTPQQEQSVVSSVAKSPAPTSTGASGILGKIGAIANVAGSILPGPIGLIAKTAGSVLNDDEWWLNEQGTELTTNVPLMTTQVAGISSYSGKSARPAFAEFVGKINTDPLYPAVLTLTQDQVDTYVIPKLRKVVNAVAMQPVDQYKHCVEISASAYAMWQHLKKLRYLTEHIQPYFPNIIDPLLSSILLPENKSYLDSLIAQLETKLRSSVRLPHTLCQMLAWRFGRIYKSNTSKKAGLIWYAPFKLGTPVKDGVESIQVYVDNLMAEFSRYPQALADLYNTFDGHTWAVNIDDATQFSFDYKEFVLRTNLEIAYGSNESNIDPKLVIMDSELTNRTTFMSSTVSTYGTRGQARSILIPVERCDVYIYFPRLGELNQFKNCYDIDTVTSSATKEDSGSNDGRNKTGGWFSRSIESRAQFIDLAFNGTDSTSTASVQLQVMRNMSALVADAMLCKYLDIYNMFLFVGYQFRAPAVNAVNSKIVWDLTGICIDTGLVQSSIIATEHNYAVANLFSDTKHYQSKGEAKREIAKEAVALAAELPPVPPKDSEGKSKA